MGGKGLNNISVNGIKRQSRKKFTIKLSENQENQTSKEAYI